MIDGIHLVTYSLEAADRAEHLPGAQAVMDAETGQWTCTVASYKGITVKVKPSQKETGKITIIEGSIHRYLKTKNDDTFTLGEMKRAVRKIEKEFGVAASECKVTYVELGVNLPCNAPYDIIGDAMLFGSKVCNEDIRKPNHRGKVWTYGTVKNTNYTVKLYWKGPTTLRYELKFDRLAKLRSGIKVAVNSLADLCSETFWLDALRVLTKQAKRFLFVPVEGIDVVPPDLQKRWESCRNAYFWEAMSRDIKHDRKVWIQLVNRSLAAKGVVDWQGFMCRGLVRQGAAMLGLSVPATLSALGLPQETVAVTRRDGNRQSKHTQTKNSAKAETSARTHYTSVDHLTRIAGLHREAVLVAHMTVMMSCVVNAPNARGPPSIHRVGRCNCNEAPNVVVLI